MYIVLVVSCNKIIIISLIFNRSLPHIVEFKRSRGPFHKNSYERFLLYEFVEPVFNYRSNEFVALTNLCETGPSVMAT